jgi:hypothetical protein
MHTYTRQLRDASVHADMQIHLDTQTHMHEFTPACMGYKPTWDTSSSPIDDICMHTYMHIHTYAGASVHADMHAKQAHMGLCQQPIARQDARLPQGIFLAF